MRNALNESTQFSHLKSHVKETRQRKVVRGNACLGLAQREGKMCFIVTLAQRVRGLTRRAFVPVFLGDHGRSLPHSWPHIHLGPISSKRT